MNLLIHLIMLQTITITLLLVVSQGSSNQVKYKFYLGMDRCQSASVKITVSQENSVELDVTPDTLNKNNEGKLQVVNPNNFLLGPNFSFNDRFDGISNAIDWIKEELKSMQAKDKQLARSMITLRTKIASKNEEIYNEKHAKLSVNNGLVEGSLVPPTLSGIHCFPINGDCFDQNKRATWSA